MAGAPNGSTPTPLVEELLARVLVGTLATVEEDMTPHAVPVWFVWYRARIYVASRTTSRKTRHARNNADAVFVVDQGQHSCQVRDGHLLLAYLRGVEVHGRLALANPEEDDLGTVARRWSARYVETPSRDGFGVDTLENHSWLRLDPHRYASWDMSRTP